MVATLLLPTPAIGRERDVILNSGLHGGFIPESSDLVGLVASQERYSSLWQIRRWPSHFLPAPNPQTRTLDPPFPNPQNGWQIITEKNSDDSDSDDDNKKKQNIPMWCVPQTPNAQS